MEGATDLRPKTALEVRYPDDLDASERHEPERVIISRTMVCEPALTAHSSTRLSSGSVGTVLIRLCGRDVLRVPISSGWPPSPIGV